LPIRRHYLAREYSLFPIALHAFLHNLRPLIAGAGLGAATKDLAEDKENHMLHGGGDLFHIDEHMALTLVLVAYLVVER
jgi:hypothetical protein